MRSAQVPGVDIESQLVVEMTEWICAPGHLPPASQTSFEAGDTRWICSLMPDWGNHRVAPTDGFEGALGAGDGGWIWSPWHPAAVSKAPLWDRR